MADNGAELPPRPPSYPRLMPGQLDIFRAIALATVVLCVIMQIVVIYAPHEATNDYGTLNAIDVIGFPFYMAGGLLDLYLILIAIYVRRRQDRGDIHSPGYIPHPGYLLFLDIAVMGGCFGWGGINAAFAILGEDTIYTLYAITMLLVGIAHLRLMVDDCRYVHFRRKERKSQREQRKNQGVIMDDVHA